MSVFARLTLKSTRFTIYAFLKVLTLVVIIAFTLIKFVLAFALIFLSVGFAGSATTRY